LLLAHATWIEAEIPQEAHRRFRGIGAESPVFCGLSGCCRTAADKPAKNAPKFQNRIPGLKAGWTIAVNHAFPC
jgi:hypothetical protein